MATYYTEVSTIRRFLKAAGVDTTRLDDDKVNELIDEAGKKVRVDLSKKVNFTNVKPFDGSPPTPEAIRLLTEYKTCEYCLVVLKGAQRQVETLTDVMYWSKQYKDLLEAIMDNEVAIVDEDGNTVESGTGTYEISTGVGGSTDPVFGDTKYGTFSKEGPDYYGK